MAKKTEPIADDKKIKKIDGNQNNKWQLAKATDTESVKQLLDEDYEPFAVDYGVIWFKKK